MLKLTAIGVRNLHSLADTGYIELKPITILVGKNSAGKSTFARVFPLYRQSVEETKRAPILWYGRLVDFGEFDEALNRRAAEPSITFSFRLSFKAGDFKPRVSRRLARRQFLSVLGAGTIETSVSVRRGASGTYASSVTLEAFGNQVTIDFDEEGHISKLVSNSFRWEPSETMGFLVQDNVIPRFLFLRPGKKTAPSDDEPEWVDVAPLRDQLLDTVRKYVHGNTTDAKVLQLANSIPLGPPVAVHANLRASQGPASWHDSWNLYADQSNEFRSLCEATFVARIPALIEELNDSLSSFFHGVRYLEPLRATAQRYYRLQELAVGEIDSRGANIAMFLDSLDYFRRQEFTEWTSEHLGLAVEPIKAGGHLSLKVTHVGGRDSTNLADMGFGFSQVLPIAAQLWAARSTSSRARFAFFDTETPASCVVIEQPELHLHPSFQAQLADLFCAAVKPSTDSSSSLFVLAETHSPSIINRLGQLVAAGEIAVDDVQVILFEQSEPDGDTSVHIAKFNEEGVLQNWPFGFFEP